MFRWKRLAIWLALGGVMPDGRMANQRVVRNCVGSQEGSNKARKAS